MITDAIASHINDQINREMYSAHFYLALAAQAEGMNLRGTAAWFFAKHGEEMTHALKLYRYLIDQDAVVRIGEVAAPETVAPSVTEMFERTLAHERRVTAHINALVDQALAVKDHATHIFLQWFVTEQIEEEATVKDILGRVRLFGDQGQSLLLIDNELAALAARLSPAAERPSA
ncbi:MAG: ferritin [Chromatiaceae bacterium]|nr:ferritin [Chromatiaceae bacterium]